MLMGENSEQDPRKNKDKKKEEEDNFGSSGVTNQPGEHHSLLYTIEPKTP